MVLPVQTTFSLSGRKPSESELFSGFKSAIEACMLDWDEYPIPGVTFGHNSHYLTPFAVFKLNDLDQSQVTSSPAVLRCEYPGNPMTSVLNHNQQPLANPLAAAPPANDQSEEENGSKPDSNPGGQLNSLNSENGNNSDEGMGDELALLDGALGLPSGSNPTSEDPGDPEDGDDASKEDNNYEVYYYDPKDTKSSSDLGSNLGKNKITDRPDVFKNLRTIEDLDKFEVLFMRAEGIYAHGYHSHACKMAVSLAQDLLKSPPDLTLPSNVATEATGAKGKKKRILAASHSLTHKASTTLSHCAFLCTVLSEVPEYHSLAFQVGMFGIEMTRLPASTKPMEVKLAHQEAELVTLLKKIPLGPQEIGSLRERASLLREGTLRLRGDALLPLMLASYIFESLVTSSKSLPNKGDEILGFEACVAAIGLKANVSEAEHPLLCEGTRRQRGDLALQLLVHYKDYPDKLAKVMDKLLDKDIHQLFKAPIQTSYYAQQPQRSITAALRNMNLNSAHQHGNSSHQQQQPSNNNQQERWTDWEAYLSPGRSRGLLQGNGQEANRTPQGANRSSGTGPGSDSGSSGNSSADSIDSSSSSKNARNYPHEFSPDIAAGGAVGNGNGQSLAQQAMGAASQSQQPAGAASLAQQSSSGHSVYTQGMPTPPLGQHPL